MNCTRCAQPIEPGATFCGNCGQPVQAPAPTTPAPVLVPEPAAPLIPGQPLPPAPVNTSVAPTPPAPAAQMPAYMTQPAQALPATPTAPTAVAVPSYAMANPVQQKSETKSMVGLVLAILGVPGALIPFLGLGFGITGLIIGTTTRATAKKMVSTMTIVFAALAIVASIGSYMYNYNKLAEQNANGGSSSQTNGTDSKTAGSVRSVDTACFKADFPQLKTLDNADGSCTLKTYNDTSTSAATNIYTVDVLTQKGMTEAQFNTAAKDNLAQSLKSNLPGLVISFEKATTFAGSPAYVINGKYQGNIGVEMMFVFHQTTHGENVFVIVHGINNSTADTTALGKNWTWK